MPLGCTKLNKMAKPDRYISNSKHDRNCQFAPNLIIFEPIVSAYRTFLKNKHFGLPRSLCFAFSLSVASLPLAFIIDQPLSHLMPLKANPAWLLGRFAPLDFALWAPIFSHFIPQALRSHFQSLRSLRLSASHSHSQSLFSLRLSASHSHSRLLCSLRLCTSLSHSRLLHSLRLCGLHWHFAPSGFMHRSCMP